MHSNRNNSRYNLWLFHHAIYYPQKGHEQKCHVGPWCFSPFPSTHVAGLPSVRRRTWFHHYFINFFALLETLGRNRIGSTKINPTGPWYTDSTAIVPSSPFRLFLPRPCTNIPHPLLPGRHVTVPHHRFHHGANVCKGGIWKERK